MAEPKETRLQLGDQPVHQRLSLALSLSATDIGLIVTELAPVAAGGLVRAVWSSDVHTIVLEIHHGGADSLVLLSAKTSFTRLHLILRKPRQPPSPSAFVMLCRKHLVGARLVRLMQVGEDRIVRLDFVEKPNPEGQLAEVSLVAELMGRRGALVLMADHEILGAFTSAPRADGVRLATATEYQRPPSKPTGSAPARDRLALAAQLPDGSRSAKVAEHYRSALAAEARQRAFAQVRAALTKRRKSTRRQLAALDRDLERALEGDAHRRRAQLLMGAYESPPPRGATEVEVVDYAKPGMPRVVVPMSAELDLQGNIARCFARARKGERALPHIDTRMAKASAEIERLDDALARVAALHQDGGSKRDLDALQAEFYESRLLVKPMAPRRSRRKQTPPESEPFRRFVSTAGVDIFVGKGGRHNDTLSLKIARGNDLWLHARDWAGAHVVVRLGRGAQPDPQTLLDAAALAAHYSKGRGDSGVEVSYTAAKHVRKPRGYPQGRVTIAAAKTILVAHDPARIERLFATRPQR